MTNQRRAVPSGSEACSTPRDERIGTGFESRETSEASLAVGFKSPSARFCDEPAASSAERQRGLLEPARRMRREIRGRERQLARGGEFTILTDADTNAVVGADTS